MKTTMAFSSIYCWLVLCISLCEIAHGSSPVIMETRASTANSVSDETSNKSSGTSLRLYLVRHGETLANIQKVVVGQFDSPLTKLGQKQASALGETNFIKTTAFWRRYASDLPRTQHTAKLIDPNNAFILDDRLREIAKGARQGFPKSYTLEQCLESFRERPEEIPKSETSEDAWKRLSSFLKHIFKDAIEEASDSVSETKNLLVVCHSGSLRLLLHKLVPHAHPLLEISADTNGALDDTKRFQIPNTSLTVLELTIPSSIHIDDLDQDGLLEFISPKLIELSWVGHYDTM